MAQQKLRVALICGGKSAEHEISLISARNVADAMDANKYEVVIIGIDKAGKWLPVDTERFLAGARNPGSAKLPPPDAHAHDLAGDIVRIGNDAALGAVDVVFPILHGPFGEDGTVQGLLKLANVPFVGAGVLGSAVGMDKDVMKRLLREAGIPTARFIVARRGDRISYGKAAKALGRTVFVKPANLGSSVGISKARNKKEFDAALAEAFRFDTKILIEEFVKGREIECAVLGGDTPIASGVGEIIPHHEFYSYEAKYLDEDGAALIVPAKIPASIRRRAQALAIKTFKALECYGLGRVDFFLTKRGKLVVSEINTMPGFTKISMYPRLWAHAGITYPALIDRLIQLARERHAVEDALTTHR